MGATEIDGTAVLERVRELPGGPQLLAVAERREDAELIGGAVRDVLLGGRPRELDVVVAGDADALASALSDAIGAAAEEPAQAGVQSGRHERFRTAAVKWEGGEIDIATRRAESYPAPGALPVVEEGTPEQDRRRRDFTVNTISVALGRARRGELGSAPGALEDLRGRRLRVLHDQSFRDDPTRLMRLARYRSRLGFEPDEHTAALAAEAIGDGALATISRARYGAELRLALAEPEPVAALGALEQLGALATLHPAAWLDPELAREALAELPADGRADVLLLAALLLPLASGEERAEEALRAALEGLELSAGERDGVVSTAAAAPLLPEPLAEARTPSQIREHLRTATIEAVALAAALAHARALPEGVAAARHWLGELRFVRLQIGGDDLLAAGIAPGPEIGARLERALRRRLDGELAEGPAAELRAALEGS